MLKFGDGTASLIYSLSSMVHKMVNGSYRQTNLSNESTEYLQKREELRLAEIDLMRKREQIAKLRRELPPGAEIQDYGFAEASVDEKFNLISVKTTRLSELFTKGRHTLILYHFMYGKNQREPCPMCTTWLDIANGVAHHLAQTVDFAVVAAASVFELHAFAQKRGWGRLRLLSAGDSGFKYDLGSEDRDGEQDSTVSVFTRDDQGFIRHSYSAHPRMDAKTQERGIDLLTPLWHFMDLTPEGRGDWYPSLSYGIQTGPDSISE